jgi:LPS-assembly protein
MLDPTDTDPLAAHIRARCKPAGLLLAVAILSAARASANCPAPAEAQRSQDLAVDSFDSDAAIDIESDSAEATREELFLKGKVTIRQGARTIETRDAVMNRETNEVSVASGVEFSDPALHIRGEGAEIDPLGGATFRGAEFELPTVPARGSAERISASTTGDVSLDEVRYTTCPIGNEDWLLSASSIDISQSRGLGTGRNVRLDFKGVPILYVPYFSFPVGNTRKSGFLYPSFGSYSREGLSVPWYWNIAPNMDATLVPTFDYRRGAKLDTEFRYLFKNGSGTIEAQYLPDDQEYGGDRSLIHFASQTYLTQRLRLDIDAANASDDLWFEDFGQGPEGTSVTYLSRSLQLSHLTPNWLLFARLQDFQTIDDRIPERDRPFTVLPQFGVRGSLPYQPLGLRFSLDGELATFAHSLENPTLLETGTRLDVAPQIRLPLRTAGIYLEPAAAWRYTAYSIHDAAPGTKETRSRSLPIFSLDGGLSFERTTGSHGQRLQTLEPRFTYVYVPYRDQSDLPIFDTTLADLNLVQLFRTNRYVGGDRVSDANQLSIGVTTRLLDSGNGKQFISGTIGQAYYFRTPRVTLPGEVFNDTSTSDIVAELDLTAYQDWNVHMGVQWDPSETRSERGDVQLQYRPSHDRVINVGYRYRRAALDTTATPVPALPTIPGIQLGTAEDLAAALTPNDNATFRRGDLEQVDGSIAWPIGERWSAFGRMVYSLEDDKPLDQFAGIEYRSCCWKLRLVGRRYVRSRTGDMDTSILLQLELNGLSSVGTGADTFLERSIRGYSPRPPETPATR